MRRVIITLVVALAGLGIAHSDAAAAAKHIASGKYEAVDVVDGSNLSVKIRNNHVDFRDDGGTVCDDAGLGFVPARHRGSPIVIDGTSVSVTADVECQTVGGWVPVLPGFTLVYTYDATTGILTDSTGQTYSRT